MAKLNPETKLERNVAKWINEISKDYDGGATNKNAEKVINELMQHGCISGIVSHLIYYTDTVKFYKFHMQEIDALLKEAFDSTGIKSPSELFGDKWDDDDPLAREQHNQNLLAWFGFEETARNLGMRAKLDV